MNEYVNAVDTKLEDLVPQIASSSGGFYKFQFKLSHELNRFDNISEPSVDRPHLLSRALKLMNQCIKKSEDVENELAVAVQFFCGFNSSLPNI